MRHQYVARLLESGAMRFRTVTYPPTVFWPALVACFAAVLVSVFLPVTATQGAESDFFARHELYLDGEVEDILIGDADRDGLEDLIVFYRQPAGAGGREQYKIAFFRQDRADQFKSAMGQTWDLPIAGGLFDLADVTGDSLRELVLINSSGVFYYPLHSTRYDPASTPLFLLANGAQVPPEGVRAWDFCWPLLAGPREVIAVPQWEHLELWAADARGKYALTDSIVCGSIVHPPLSRAFQMETSAPGVSGISYCLPAPAQRLSPTATEIFLSSTAGVRAFRRDDLTKLDFSEGPQVLDAHAQAPLFSHGPFGSGVRVEDMNGDRSTDLVRWQAKGGVTGAVSELEIFYGPLTDLHLAAPHQRITVDNVTMYPLFADLDGDGRKDIVLCAIELGTITAAKMIVVKSANLYLLAYRQQPDNSFGKDPDQRLKIDCRLNTESPDLLGRVPARFADDLNSDRLTDLVVCPGQDELEIYLGEEGRLLPTEVTITLDCDAPAAVYPVDLNHDRKTDLVVLHHTKPNTAPKVTVFLTK